MVESVKEVRRVVKFAKFPPVGRRGFGSPYALQRFNPNPGFVEYLQQANDATVVIVQIETKEALESVDAIAAVNGVDVVFIGPFDLGRSSPMELKVSKQNLTMLGNNIGHPIITGEMAPQLQDAISRILSETHKAGKKCGIYATGGEQARSLQSRVSI